jgi:peptidoglycan hydrolase-like protein with peptidoglycan-binding domain
LLFGTRPMYRTLTSGIGDGPDVKQLEENLVALGMATTSTLTVDEAFTSATTTAIKKWQKSLGLDQTGTLATNEIVFAAGAVRVASHSAAPGDNASGAILAVTSTVRSVRANLSSAQLGLVNQAQQVDVQLPDGSTVKGDVTSIGTATTTTSGNGPNAQTTTSYPMAIKVPDTVTAPDGSTVSISLISTKATAVLAVPVKALVALAEGGYGVEKLSNGTPTLVGVKPGAFASGFVEVTGGVVEGDEVVVP